MTVVPGLYAVDTSVEVCMARLPFVRAAGSTAPARGQRNKELESSSWRAACLHQGHHPEDGEPVYGERDAVDIEKMRSLGLPFWLAGGTGSPNGLREALAAGANGVQVGTLFAFCEESGFSDEIKREVLERASRGEVDVHTDPLASPTGYPFKVVKWKGDSSEQVRERKCDLGYLRVAFRRGDGRVDYRCAAEPVEDYVRKGGAIADTVGRRCLCNALTANIGQAQVRPGGVEEAPLVTSGDDLATIATFLRGRTSYTASEVIDHLLSPVAA